MRTFRLPATSTFDHITRAGEPHPTHEQCHKDHKTYLAQPADTEITQMPGRAQDEFATGRQQTGQ